MKQKFPLRDLWITAVMPVTGFLLCLVIQYFYEDSPLIPAIFLLAVFLTCVLTSGYVWGVISALVSVLAVNFAFTFPYFKLNFSIPENLISAIILIAVTLITCGLTAKLKQQEAAKAVAEKERMRANLLRAVSHDLRTPLTTIYGASSAMLENFDSFTPQQHKKMLRGIQDDSLWLTRMVENLLSVTKLDNGNVKIIKTETALDELIDSVLVKFAARYPHQQVAVELPEEFLALPIDALLIEQVAINLLENAVQHAHGMTKLSLRVYTKGQKAVFEFQDDGCGLPPEVQKALFSGAAPASSAPIDGHRTNSGIGLSVCATIIKAHGGEISCESPQQGGCLFRFTLDIEDNCHAQ